MIIRQQQTKCSISWWTDVYMYLKCWSNSKKKVSFLPDPTGSGSVSEQVQKSVKKEQRGDRQKQDQEQIKSQII